MSRRIVTIAPFALPADGGMTLTEVTFQLVSADLVPVPGFADGEGIAGKVTILLNGESADVELTTNDTITPVGTLWAITIAAGGIVYRTLYRTLASGPDAVILSTWIGTGG